MVNFLNLAENPQINCERVFEVMRDFRKGGLTPSNYQEFLEVFKKLPYISERTPADYEVFDQFNLTDVSEDEHRVVMREVMRRAIEKSKICWHPEASSTTCKVDSSGKIIISAAHSLQNNGVLSKIADDEGFIVGYDLDKPGMDVKEVRKNAASIFWGFCNTHDAIFNPIEVVPYSQTAEQNFLFAYRGFVVSSHKKLEVSNWINYPSQSENDIKEIKRIFDNAVIHKKYSVIETEVFELPAFYPIAVTSSFYLDFDFEKQSIPHSEERMEDIFITFLPFERKSYFLLSYFTEDKKLYSNLAAQLRKRNNLKSDITMLIAAHTENVFFNPTYYKTFIKSQEKAIQKLMFETQFDYAKIGKEDNLTVDFSFTPDDYLNNKYEINFFGY